MVRLEMKNSINRLSFHKERKRGEIEHGRLICENAKSIWGWQSPAGKVRVKRRVSEISNRFENYKLKKLKILEIGCGTGIFTEQFIKIGIDLVASDISCDLIKVGKKAMNFKEILVADAELLPFSDESFDIILGVSILHHLDIHKSLLESKRVLKKGGKIIFSEPNMLNPLIFLQKKIMWLKKMLHDTQAETAFYRRSLRLNIEKIGFKNISVRPFDFLHPLTLPFLINIVSRFGYTLERLPFVREFSGSLLIYAEK